MTSDLVRRLRLSAEIAEEDHGECGEMVMLREAADRIEALERELVIAKATANILAGDYEELKELE